MGNPQTPTGDPILGARLREIRERAGLSVHDVEVRSRGAIRPSTLTAYERGDRALSVSRLMRLAEFYDVSVADVLARDEIDLRDNSQASPPPSELIAD
jgi:transcriptional regulator with XRE-family HTH domain